LSSAVTVAAIGIDAARQVVLEYDEGDPRRDEDFVLPYDGHEPRHAVGDALHAEIAALAAAAWSAMLSSSTFWNSGLSGACWARLGPLGLVPLDADTGGPAPHAGPVGVFRFVVCLGGCGRSSETTPRRHGTDQLR